MNKILGWMKDHAATLLSWGATVGTVGGAVAAVKAVDRMQVRICEAAVEKFDRRYTEALERIKEEEPGIPSYMAKKKASLYASENSGLTRWEEIKASISAFIPAILIEGVTIGCIHGSNCINKREISALNRTITGLNESLAAATVAYTTYQDCVGRLTDRTTEYAASRMAEEQARAAENGDTPWDEVRTFYIDGQPEFFERTMEEVFKAEMELNRAFAIVGLATINDFYRLLRLPTVPDGDMRGFESYLGEMYYGYRWIDFSHQPYMTEDGLWVTEIVMPIDPHPLDEDEVNAELDAAINRFNEGVMDLQGMMAQKRREREANGLFDTSEYTVTETESF